MKAFVAWQRGMPMLARWVSTGAISAAVTGGIVGLIVGLFAYPPTALFAAVELGVPAVVAGGVVGLVGGVIMTTARCIRRHRARVCSRVGEWPG